MPSHFSDIGFEFPTEQELDDFLLEYLSEDDIVQGKKGRLAYIPVAPSIEYWLPLEPESNTVLDYAFHFRTENYNPVYLAEGNLDFGKLPEVCNDKYEESLGILRDIQEFYAQIIRGEFQAIHTWFHDKIHQYGFTYPIVSVMERATGGEIQSKNYPDYMKKYIPFTSSRSEYIAQRA